MISLRCVEKISRILILGFGLFGTSAWAISLDWQSQTSAVPLTTERVTQLDPNEVNPARTQAVASHRLEMIGIQIIPPGSSADQAYRVQLSQVRAIVQTYLRTPVPAVADTTDRSGSSVCTPPVVARALETRLKSVLEILLPRLAGDLLRVRGVDESDAVEKADLVFEVWKLLVEQTTIEKSLELSCQIWSPEDKPRALAPADLPKNDPASISGVRSPARKVSGRVAIRVGLSIADKNLSGLFLLDPTLAGSQVSEAWLTSQGIMPSLIASRLSRGPGARSFAIPLSIGGKKQTALTFSIVPGRALRTSDPECCDGVLGRDYLRQVRVSYWMETSPPAIEIFPNSAQLPSPSFARGGVEIPISTLGSKSTLVSDSCRLFDRAKNRVWNGWVWNLGRSEGLGLAAADRSKTGTNTLWEGYCGDARVFVPTSAQAAQVGSPERRFSVSVGGKMLENRNWVLDLSNNRIWISNP
jgi:hypothetical protein